jgi:hypothetical protein
MKLPKDVADLDSAKVLHYTASLKVRPVSQLLPHRLRSDYTG